MKVAIGCDHAGFEHKAALLAELAARSIEITDCGTEGTASCDYPDFAGKVAALVASGKVERGVLICGSGQGMCMTANRFAGVRAALVYDEFTARITRQHNDSNVICLGARVMPAAEAARLLGVWLETPFEGGRHLRRVQKIDTALSDNRVKG